MLFNNEGDDHEKATQREQLIDLVKTIVKENGGRCFRHKISHELDITMENMVREEIRARTLFQEETPEEKEKAGGDDVRQAENQAVLRKKEVEDLKKRGKVKARLLQFSQSPSPEPAPEKPARLYSKGTPQGNLESKNAAFNQHQDQPLKKLTPTDGSPFVYEVPDNPGMTLAENKRLVKYALMSKVVSCPEELNDAQKEELNKAVKSVGTKFKEGMNKFALKAINQCRLMWFLDHSDITELKINIKIKTKVGPEPVSSKLSPLGQWQWPVTQVIHECAQVTQGCVCTKIF